MIEKEFAGFGASGRNGGWCSGEFGWNRERYLSTGTLQGVIDMKRQLRATVAEVHRVTEKESIDCDSLMTDCLTCACSPTLGPVATDISRRDVLASANGKAGVDRRH